MWNEEERDKMREEWLKRCIDEYKSLPIHLYKSIFHEEEEIETEERNDVYIYKTIRYPPKSKPPIAD